MTQRFCASVTWYLFVIKILCISPIFQRFVRELLEPSFKKTASITSIPEGYEAIKFHSMLVASSCYYGVAECEHQTLDLFKMWYTEANPDENNPLVLYRSLIPTWFDFKKVYRKCSVERPHFWKFFWYIVPKLALKKQGCEAVEFGAGAEAGSHEFFVCGGGAGSWVP